MTTPIENITPDGDLGALLQRAGEIKERLDVAQKAREEGKEIAESVAELRTNYEAVKASINEWQKAENERTAEAEATQIRKDLDALLAQTRKPSKASVIGGFGRGETAESALDSFFQTVAFANSPKLAGGFQESIAAKARLEEMGSRWAGVDPASKATVGDTDAAGGYLVPNPVVLNINEQATAPRSVVDLFTPINGVNGSAVDLPWEQETISRAVIASPGSTKENSDFITNNYTATLYTLARIFDVGNQLLRQSQGAAEQLVRSKLARAFALGEDYYAIQGSGSSQPYGLLTAIGTSGTYVSTFSSPSDSTVAGSVISAVLTAAGALANRGAVPDGVVLNSADFYEMARQGSDNAGFWRDPFMSIQAAGTDVAGPGGLRWRHSPNMPSDSLVVGEYRSALFIRGQGYRVDSSSEAGTRWDKNETGFRGEEEIAFDARPAVYTGHFQRITNAIA